LQRLLSARRLLLLLLLAAPGLCGAREYLQVFVVAPYLELHTGPGRGYPVFDVVDRDGSVDVLAHYTEWFKVRTERDVVGWVSERDMAHTVLADGSAFTFERGDRAGFTSHRFEMGMFAGEYGGATLISAYSSFSFNSQLALELSVGQFLGNASNGVVGDIGLTHVFLPEWRWSPFVMIGTGIVHTEPKATLVQPLNRTEQTAYVGGGVRYYLTRRFFLRAEYKNHIVFTKLNSNEEVDEWKLGFAFFY
jgi:Bacterial SH3 domain